MKNYLTPLRDALATKLSPLVSEFKKHPSYYLSSAALRIAMGAGVAYGLSYGLTSLAVPYVASTQAGAKFLSLFMNHLSTVTNALSAIGALLASTKLSDTVLTHFFGTRKFTATFNNAGEENQEAALSENNNPGYLSLLGQHRPYDTVPTVSEIQTQLENELKAKAAASAPDQSVELSAENKTFVLLQTKQLVEANKDKFGPAAQATVQADSYLSPASSLKAS